MKCRFDGEPVSTVMIDLGFSPPSNSYLLESELNQFEEYYPLKLWVSERSFLVQLEEVKNANEIFSDDYAYFSSYSSSWLNHCRNYVEDVYKRFNINQSSSVIEIASNDGYLLQFFKEKNVPVLGIEPTANTAEVAVKKGIPTIVKFFGENLAKELVKEGNKADLLIGNNVLAHVPDLNDFIRGIKVILKDDGVVTLEFPHLMRLIEENQFDTIYHEHFSYFSLYTVQLIFQHHGIEIFDVDEIPTHGGSLRVYAQKLNGPQIISDNVSKLIETEFKNGLTDINTYKDFHYRTEKIKYDLLEFLIEQKREGKVVAAYGAAAKGNTLINYSGIKPDLIKFVADKNPHKQQKFLPGSHIPITSPDSIRERKPDYVLILPWNIKEEIMDELGYIKDWNGSFVTAIPELIIH